ncbi:hypothetical protein [Streptomyces carpaticus]|uniref:hypothetical protein n=1 Tax=Streptomyces carpaticus TaxID=285558 RepID=UPI0031F7D4C5
MAFPEDPLDVVVEAQIAAGNGWVNISGDSLSRDPIRITRGRADEAASVDPSRATLTLNNRDGRYSPRNPLGPYYGQLGRNSRVGVWVRGHERYVRPTGPGGCTEVASTPELDIAADLDLALEVTLWRVPSQSGTWDAETQELAGRYQIAGEQRSWRLLISDWGRPRLGWSPDGTTLLDAAATEALPCRPEERFALRVTLDVDNGAGGWTARFYTAPSIDVAEATGWRQLGEPVTGAGTTSVYNPSAPLQIGDITGLGFLPGYGMYFRAQLRDGIGGPLVADLDARQLPFAATSWVDSVGRSWERRLPSALSDLYPRIIGEAVSWPTRWDESARDVWTPLEIAGPLRRLGAGGAKALQSTLRRLIPTHTALRAYWPMEDGADSTSAASGLTGGRTATTTSLDYGAEAGLVSSAPLPTIGRSGASMRVSLPGTGAPSGTGWRVEMIYKLEQVPGSQPALYEMLDLETSGGGIARITALFGPGLAGGGEARVVAYDSDDAIVGTGWWTDSAAIAAAVSGWCRVRIACVPVSGGWAYRMWWTRVGVGESWWTTTVALPYSTPSRINTSWPAALAGMPVGHVTYVNNNTVSVYGDGSGAAEDALRGERAASRIRRLAQEERLLLAASGIPADSARVGPQRIDTVLGLVREAAEADGGLLFEPRFTRGLHYMPRYLLYDRPPDLVLDYAAGHIAEPLEPQPDDLEVVNDLEVSRPGGGRGRAVQEEGPLSVADPPAGIGRYDASSERNLFADSQLEPASAWSVHQATRPEERWPTVRIDMAAPGITPADRQAILDRLDVGAVVRIVGTPPWVAPGPVDLVVEGYTEEIGHPNDWVITLNCSPASRWRTGQVVPARPGDETAPVHVDTDGSQLAAAAGPDDTTVSVIATVGPSWTTDPTDTPFDVAIGGERMTVTAVGAPGAEVWAGAGDRYEWQDALAATAPSVDGPGGLLVCLWSGFGQPANEYVPPGSMTAGPIVRGQYASTITGWQTIGPGPSGTRTVTVTGEPDAWSAVAVRATGGTVAGHWSAHGSSAAATITTTAATLGQWLLAITGWDWDPGGFMGEPSPGAWQLITESGGATSSTCRLRAWARPITAPGPQSVTFNSGTNVFDVHLRVWLLSGVPSSAAQPFAVIRAVNGIEKPHGAGADVRLADPMIVGL